MFYNVCCYTFHERMNSHRADILHGRLDGKPALRHFNSAGHSINNVRVMIIDHSGFNDDLTRKCQETRSGLLKGHSGEVRRHSYAQAIVSEN